MLFLLQLYWQSISPVFWLIAIIAFGRRPPAEVPTGALLDRENGTIKTKAGASLYLTGIGKVKSRLTLKGVASSSTAKGDKATRLIVKAKDNTTDPNSFINIFKFEIKGKERRYQLAETGTLSKTETNNLSSVEYNAKIYGKNSYLIIMNNLTPGEYGIVFGDPNNANTKNEMKVTTFTVKQADFLKKD